MYSLTVCKNFSGLTPLILMPIPPAYWLLPLSRFLIYTHLVINVSPFDRKFAKQIDLAAQESISLILHMCNSGNLLPHQRNVFLLHLR